MTSIKPMNSAALPIAVPAVRHPVWPLAPADDRQQHEDEDRGDILEDEPSDGDSAVRCLHQPVIHEPAEQHDRAGDRHRHAQQQARRRHPAPAAGQPEPERRRKQHLDHGARDRDVAHLPEILEGEMEPDAEHQEDHAELGELTDCVRVADEAGRERPHGDTRQQVARDRWQPDAPGEQASNQGVAQGHGDVDQEREFMWHRLRSVCSGILLQPYRQTDRPIGRLCRGWQAVQRGRRCSKRF
jgi:hypothetical protein